ncbi:hypothetical protein BsWGS_01969 [Bradybaena similaris]
MAGVSKDCGWVSYSHTSCLSFGRVDVFSSNETSSCECTEGHTIGVLCCKKPKQAKAVCEQDCGSKGVCIQPNTCRCQEGYSGDTCRQKAMLCKPACLNGAHCHKGKCKCSSSFWGKLCQYPYPIVKDEQNRKINSPALNG